MTTADDNYFAFLAFQNWATHLGNICKYAIAGLVSKHVSTHEIGATQEVSLGKKSQRATPTNKTDRICLVQNKVNQGSNIPTHGWKLLEVQICIKIIIMQLKKKITPFQAFKDFQHLPFKGSKCSKQLFRFFRPSHEMRFLYCPTWCGSFFRTGSLRSKIPN